MQPFKIKQAKSLDIDSKLKEYVVKNYDANSLSEKVKKFFGEINQNRAVISKMDQNQSKVEMIKQSINITTHYINELNALKTKMTFGKEIYSCKIEFTWTDVIKNNNWTSFNIYFEIYNALFNLASLYYALGFFTGISENADKNVRKEATKYFKNAMYIFTTIKNEASAKINMNELPSDLSPLFLDYCISMCVVYGNIQILEIAKVTSPNEFSLLGKLAYGISDNYRKAFSLSNEALIKKGGDDNFRNFLLNRANYYKGLMFKFLRDGSKKKFDDSGLGYGEMLFYQGLFVQELIECEKNVKKCGKFVNVENFISELELEKNKGADFLDLNNRIYHQLVPKIEDMNFEKKDLMSPVIPEDLYINENEKKLNDNLEISNDELDLVVPRQVKEMINRYKSKMNEFIKKNLNDCENENTISDFVRSLNLPERLTKKKTENSNEPPKEIPPQLYEKLNKIHQIGGINTLTNIMDNITNKSNYLIKSLETVLNSFCNEDRDDAMCRQRFGDNKWIRKPSSALNGNYVQAVRQFINNINQTKQFDIKEKNEINDESKYYENVLLPMNEIINKIPKKDEIKLESTEEESEVRKQINELYDLSEKCMTIINKIFSELNDDSLIVSSFVEVLVSKTTEQAIFEKNKENYENKFTELKTLSEQVQNQKKTITNSCQKIYKNIANEQKMNINEDAMNYFRQLDQSANMFMSRFDKVKKGDNYYNNLKQKVDDLIKKCNDWMINRNDEKNALISTISGNRGAYGNANLASRNYMDSNAYTDASKNPFTNMNVADINHQGNWGRGNYGQGYGNQGGY